TSQLLVLDVCLHDAFA
ncbi:DUF645 family protein, partial [Vibrio cholerae]